VRSLQLPSESLSAASYVVETPLVGSLLIAPYHVDSLFRVGGISSFVGTLYHSVLLLHLSFGNHRYDLRYLPMIPARISRLPLVTVALHLHPNSDHILEPSFVL